MWLGWPGRDVNAQAATTGPVVARFRLVRCTPNRDAACLASRLVLPPDGMIGGASGTSMPHWSAQLAGVGMIGADQTRISGATQPDITPVFGVPVLKAMSLGRTSLLGTISLSAASGQTLRLRAAWRPPLLSLPAFTGTADSASLPAPIRDALAVGGDSPRIRPLLLLVLSATGLLLLLYVPHFLWEEHRDSEEDLAQQVAAARALLSTQELEQLRGVAPREAKPRTPEEPTHESATLPRTRP